MYLKKKDAEILKFVRNNGSITITQCSKIFYTKNKQSYQQARKRLKQLSNNNFLKRYRKDMQSECIYYINTKLSVHDLKVLDIYAELIKSGATIKNFISKYRIDTPGCKKTYREADALFEFVFKGYLSFLLVEVDYTHFTSKNKILDIYNSNHFQKKYNEYGTNIFPDILIIRPFENEKNLTIDETISIYYTSFEHPNISSIL